MKVSSVAANEAYREQLSESHWYVVRSNPNQERLARMSLLADGLDVYFPVFPKMSKTGDVSSVSMFPNYLFVRLVLGSSAARCVFSARGVQSVIGNGTRPSPVAEVAVQRVRRIEEEEFEAMGLMAQQVKFPTFNKGDEVVIQSGPLLGLTAEYIRKLDANRGQVLLKVIGDSPRLGRISIALGSLKATSGADAIKTQSK